MPAKIRSSDELNRLSPRQVDVLTQIAAGRTAAKGAGELGITIITFNRHSVDAGYRLRRFSNASKVGAALATGQVQGPKPPCRAPDLDVAELFLLRAVAQLSHNEQIARAIGLPHAEVKTKVTELVAKAGAANPAHLVGLGDAWGLLGATGPHRPTTPPPAPH